MATLIAMHGLPRSGKSTVSRELSRNLAAPIVSKDCIRLAIHGQPYIGLAEDLVRAISKVMVRALFEAGHEYVIADETHYSRAARDFMRDGPWETYFYPVPTDAETCMQRARDTNQPWLLEVIPQMVARYEPLGNDEPRCWLNNFTGSLMFGGRWEGMIPVGEV
jgi:tRNA uridine 5-carbamoylmethylation protein Kti12